MAWSDIDKKTWLVDGLPEVSTADASGNPALYKANMQAFLKAGSTVLRAYSSQEVALCREIAPEEVMVWASLQPAQKLLALREVEPAELAEHYKQQLQSIVEAAPDVILFESMVDLEDASIALKVAKDVTDIPIGITFTFGSGVDLAETVMGVSCEDAISRVVDERVDLVGSSGVLDADQMVLIVRLIRDACELPIIVCPQAGERELDEDRIVYRESPADFASKISSLINAGANVIGGAEGISPEHIAAAADEIGAR